MKRIAYVLLVIFLLIGLVDSGCAGTEHEIGPGRETAPPSPREAAPPGMGGSAQTGTLQVTFEDAFIVDREAEENASWDSSWLNFGVLLSVCNFGPDNDGFKEEDVYIISSTGKVYHNLLGDPGYQEFKASEVRKLVYMWGKRYRNESEPYRSPLPPKDSTDLILVVGKATSKLPRITTCDLLTRREFNDSEYLQIQRETVSRAISDWRLPWLAE